MRTDRKPIRTALAALCCCAAISAGATVAAAPAKPDFGGVWLLDESLAPVAAAPRPGPAGLARGWRALGGWRGKGSSPPPLLPAALAAVRKEQTLELAGRKWEPKAAACKPMSAFDVMSQRVKLDIFQHWNELLVIAESDRTMPRHIYIDRNHPPAEEVVPSVTGDAVAKWEGQTLVVDTVGVDPAVYLISADYIPPSASSHVVERIRLLDASTLQDTVTVTDPKVLARPWTYTLTYRKQPSGTQLVERGCDREARMRDVQP